MYIPYKDAINILLVCRQDGRPRNLGRGVSKPKKNTVASLLAQSRALGIKPTSSPEILPHNHQVSLLKSNVLTISPTVIKGVLQHRICYEIYLL